MTRGAFIVIEGLDRSGKTTQTSSLLSKLQSSGKSVVLMKFPDRTTPIGKMIDSYLRSQSELEDHAIHLLFSANRWELASQIESHLQSGTLVLCDRYAFSGISFSSSKGLPYTWCRSPDISLPSPDLTLFLDISPSAAQSRGGYGQERYETELMQRSVRNIFHRIGEETTAEGGSWVVIDAGRDKETVFEDMWNHIQPFVDGVEGPIGRLWAPVPRAS